MDHRNLRGARRGVAKEQYRRLDRQSREGGFVALWQSLNDRLRDQRFYADQKRKMGHVKNHAAA